MFYINKNNKELKNIFNDNFLDDIFNLSKTNKSSMRADLIENENDYSLSVEIPGINKEDINISYEDSRLTISAEKKTENTTEKTNYVHKEIFYGSYSRTFFLENVDKDNIKASYVDGILNINLPKSKTDNTKKYINIE